MSAAATVLRPAALGASLGKALGILDALIAELDGDAGWLQPLVEWLFERNVERPRHAVALLKLPARAAPSGAQRAFSAFSPQPRGWPKLTDACHARVALGSRI